MCASTGCQRRSSLTEGRRTLFSKKSFLFLTRLFNVLYLLGIQQGSKRFRLQKRLLQIVIANCNCASFQFSIRILCLAITLCSKTRLFYEKPSFSKIGKKAFEPEYTRYYVCWKKIEWKEKPKARPPRHFSSLLLQPLLR